MTPLLGCKVVDFSHMIAGPFATFYLAQLGATVTKVESPNGGDMMRRTRPNSTSFEAVNSGKVFTEIDIKTPAGQQAALALAAQADVFLNNYRPGVLERHGLGYEALREINPRIVYCAISGYGQHQDLAQRGAYDHVIQGLTGMAMMAGNEGDPPVKIGFPLVDAAAGIIGALAIVSALHERDRTGKGCMLDVSMWAAALQVMYPFACDAMTAGTSVERVGNQGYSGSPAADFFQCLDGWISVGANTTKQLTSLLQVLDIPQSTLTGILQSSADASDVAGARDPMALKAVLREAMASQHAAELELKFSAAGVPAARVRKLHEFVAEFRDQGFLQPVMLGAGATQSPGLGWRVVPT